MEGVGLSTRKSFAVMYVFKMNDLGIVQPLKKTAIHLIKHILKTLSPIITTTNQLNRDLQSQVTGVLQSNAGSSSSTGFFSLAYQRLNFIVFHWDQPLNS